MDSLTTNGALAVALQLNPKAVLWVWSKDYYCGWMPFGRPADLANWLNNFIGTVSEEKPTWVPDSTT